MHEYPSASEAAAACSGRLLELLRHAVAQRGTATLAVSGGSTPMLLFQEMVNSDFPWDNLRLFFVDERCVPPDDDQSNYRLAREHFLKVVGFPDSHVVRVKGELPPENGAKEYVAAIRESFELAVGGLPIFDVVQLGLGPDGHTASLFPGGEWGGDRTGIAAAVWVEKMGNYRVTLLPGVLLAARARLFLVAGEDKKAALEAVLHGPVNVDEYPAQIVARDDIEVEWFVGQV